MISNTQQKVTDAYRNNPFWDTASDETSPEDDEELCLCGSTLTDGCCDELLRQQAERT